MLTGTERVGHRPSLDVEFLGPCRRESREVRFGVLSVALSACPSLPIFPAPTRLVRFVPKAEVAKLLDYLGGAGEKP